ncbi:Ankyrin repeat and zinc finger domain-containing protein 1 [Desmophyllum pertusum]|uniref:Ankyrin repeat and zinc finger domain-containing protein 1 n=1 Tax=Desmophyllum pertusum TaxID=174260 RepID=A0A9W9ZE67_9CNID|nr:Ankyrin repeat and zinc finger domain-containing protein 1 [Desmophyllum pertusum]
MATATNSMARSCVSLFDQELNDLLMGVRIVGKDLGNGSGNDEQLEALNKERDHRKELQLPEAGDKPGMSCSVFQVVFESVDIQREHFKLDWHRFNLKQKLFDKPILSEDAFEETISGELSSISGSDSDTDSDSDLALESSRCSKPLINELLPEELMKTGHAQLDDNTQRCFLSMETESASVYRSVLYSVKNIPATPDATLSLFTSLPNNYYWIVLMTAGGHFAGAVFNERSVDAQNIPSIHSQSKTRNSPGCKRCTAGWKATKEVQDLLEAWSKHVEQCDRIFIRTPAYNKAMFFGGKKPPFKKDDVRIRTILSQQEDRHSMKEGQRCRTSGPSHGVNTDKSNRNLPSVDEDDKIRLWQDSQHIDINSEVKKKDDLQERHVSNENGDEDLPDAESKAKPQETSKKTKKKKAKNKKAVDMLQNGEGALVESALLCYCVSKHGSHFDNSWCERKSTEEPDLKTGEACLPQATNQALDVTSNYGISDLKNNELLESDAEVTRTCERHERKLNVNSSDDSNPDSKD